MGALEVALHDRLVDLDDRFQQRLADLVGIDQRACGVGGYFERAGHAAEIGPLPQRHVQQRTRLAEQFLDVLHQLGEIDVLGVHLVQHDHASQARVARLVENATRVDPDPRLGVDHHDRRIDGAQRADRLSDVVRVARRVDDVEPLAGVLEVDHRAFDRVLVLLLFIVEIADAGAVIDAGWPAEGPGEGQQLIDERRLAGRTVAAKGYVPDIRDLVLRHVQFPLKSSDPRNDRPLKRAPVVVAARRLPSARRVESRFLRIMPYR